MGSLLRLDPRGNAVLNVADPDYWVVIEDDEDVAPFLVAGPCLLWPTSSLIQCDAGHDQHFVLNRHEQYLRLAGGPLEPGFGL